MGKGKGKADHAQMGIGGVLISLTFAVSLQVDKPLKSVPHGQCDTRPTVTFPAAEHHHPLVGTKLYCLVSRVRTIPVLGYWVLGDICMYWVVSVSGDIFSAVTPDIVVH